jgi:hypothetical protein
MLLACVDNVETLQLQFLSQRFRRVDLPIPAARSPLSAIQGPSGSNRRCVGHSEKLG